jgi:undecaprenyl pyrophosphate synthase
MWTEKEVTINKKKINCLVNRSEIEVPFNDGISKVKELSVDGKSHKIINQSNVGDRDEIILITIEVNNESESDKSRESSKLSK